MKVEIQNEKLEQAISLLFNLPLRAKESRHRTKFIKILGERLKEFEQDRIELAKEHAEKDEDGEPKVKDGRYILADQTAFAKDFKELKEEKVILEGSDYHVMLETVKEVLENCEETLSGAEAVIYDYLCEQFEKGADENV